MKITFHLIILKCVNKYGIFRNNKNIDKVSQNKFHNFSKQCCLFKGVNIYFKVYIFAFVFQIRVVVVNCFTYCKTCHFTSFENQENVYIVSIC